MMYIVSSLNVYCLKMSERKFTVKKLHRQYKSTYIHYKDPSVIKTISDLIITFLPKSFSNIVVVCIGTDRSTGDSLGPLTGTFLSDMKLNYLNVFGTLHDPVHAVNLEDSISQINRSYDNPYIIAIDASLGKSSSIGNFIVGKGSIQPGAALDKQLPAVGNAHVTGVVNIAGFMDYAILQSTRLSIVHDMSYKIARTIKKIDVWLHYYLTNRTNKGYQKFNESI